MAKSLSGLMRAALGAGRSYLGEKERLADREEQARLRTLTKQLQSEQISAAQIARERAEEETPEERKAARELQKRATQAAISESEARAKAYPSILQAQLLGAQTGIEAQREAVKTGEVGRQTTVLAAGLSSLDDYDKSSDSIEDILSDWEQSGASATTLTRLQRAAEKKGYLPKRQLKPKTQAEPFWGWVKDVAKGNFRLPNVRRVEE